MELLNVAKHRREDVNLLPVQRHVDQHKLCQVLVDKRVDILAIEESPVDAPELVACQNQRAQVPELLYDLEVLIPAVEEVLVEVEDHRAWDAVPKSVFKSEGGDAHSVERHISDVLHIRAPVIGHVRAENLDLLDSTFLSVDVELSLLLFARLFQLRITHHTLGFVFFKDRFAEGLAADLDLAMAYERAAVCLPAAEVRGLEVELAAEVLVAVDCAVVLALAFLVPLDAEPNIVASLGVVG